MFASFKRGDNVYQPNLVKAMTVGLPQDVLAHLSSQIEA
jgi:hypothetical protein